MRALLILMFLVTCAAGPARAGTPLDVLLTNDDGWEAAGLRAVAEALRAAGHRVRVVAPLEQQSGTGVKVTLGEMAVEQRTPDTWSVAGSPADTVSYAFSTLYGDGLPDVVVSGANLGQNLGANVVSSGTLGAAVMAVNLGVPAVAVSVGLNLAEAKATPERFPSTLAAYPHAARLVVRVLETLESTAGEGPLLPPGLLLNLNYPARPATEVKGLALAHLGHYGGFRLVYPAPAPGAVQVSTMEADPRGASERGSDTALFAAGHATVSVLDTRWQAGEGAVTGVGARLGNLADLLAP